MSSLIERLRSYAAKYNFDEVVLQMKLNKDERKTWMDEALANWIDEVEPQILAKLDELGIEGEERAYLLGYAKKCITVGMSFYGNTLSAELQLLKDEYTSRGHDLQVLEALDTVIQHKILVKRKLPLEPVFELVFEEDWSYAETGFQIVFGEYWTYFEPAEWSLVFQEGWGS
jgi:hypothetical protein